MKKFTKTQLAWRLLIYIAGMIILAAGITLNTKTGLGVSPIISIPFTISSIWGLDFAAMTFASYAAFVVIEIIIKGKQRTWTDLLQIPFSFVFSLLLNLFTELFAFSFDKLWMNLLVLLTAILATAVGADMMVNMKLIANPADALAHAVGMATKKGMGFGKNVIDCSSVVVSCLLGLIFAGRITAIGVGTVVAMLGIGRTIAVFNRLFKRRMLKATGLQ